MLSIFKYSVKVLVYRSMADIVAWDWSLAFWPVNIATYKLRVVFAKVIIDAAEKSRGFN